MVHAGIQRPNISSRILPCRSQQQPLARRVSPRAAALHRASAETLPAARLWLPAPEASITAAFCTPGRSQCRLRTSVAVSQWQWSTSVEGSRRRLPRRAQAIASEGEIAYEPRKKGFKTPKKVRGFGRVQSLCRSTVGWRLVFPRHPIRPVVRVSMCPGPWKHMFHTVPSY